MLGERFGLWIPTNLNANSGLTFASCFSEPQGFPDSSVGKEFACNAGDRILILGSERSAGEGIGYPFQYSWAALVAQLVKNLPAMQETWIGEVNPGKS